MPASFQAPTRLIASPSLYLVYRSRNLASVFDIRSHSLQNCTARAVLPRYQTMAETTPLLPRTKWPSRDLPIFLRVCHSPWPFISQRSLLTVRAVIASFLTIVFTLDLLYRVNYTQRGQQFAFEPSTISLAMQMLYYWITTVGVLSLLCINPLISLTVLDHATYLSTIWSIASRRTSQGQIPSPNTSWSLGTNVH